MIKLSGILSGISGLSVIGDSNLGISGIAFDSRRVTKGTLFVATTGKHSDGHLYIPAALEMGAVAVMCTAIPENHDPTVTWIISQDSSADLGKVAANFFGQPSEKMKW